VNIRKLSLITLLACAIAASTAAASAATLTSTEYQQLLGFQSSAAKATKTMAALKRAERSCGALSPVSAMMRAYRHDCAATFTWLQDSIAVLKTAKGCAHQPTVDARFACLTPVYSRLARAVRTMYRDEQRVYRAVVARGFSGSCRSALSDGPKAIRHEAQMVADMARAVTALHHDNVFAAQKWGSLYDAATAETEAAASRVSVSVCPHL
jgi:hypothetical protein